MPPAELGKGFAGITNTSVLSGPFAGLAGLVGLAWLALILRIDAFVSPSGTGLIYTTGTSRISYGLARNRYYPQIFGKVDRNGIPWVGLIFAFLIGLLFLLPFPSWHSLVGLITGASVLMYAGAPLSLGAFRGQVPEAQPAVPDAGRRRARPGSRSSSPTCSSTGRASRWSGSSASSLVHRLRPDRHLAWRSTRSGRRWTGSPPCGCRSG